MAWTKCLAMLMFIVPLVQGYPDGPPVTACVDQRPGTAVGSIGMIGHVTMPQNYMPGPKRESPYYIHIYQTAPEYQPNAEITVGVIANQTLSMNHFKGVLLSARKLICRSNYTTLVGDELLGSFTVPIRTEDSLLKTMNCEGGTNNAVCHRSRQVKINETFTWRAPDEYRGHVVFRATIVQEATVYWSEVHSRALIDPSLGPEPPTCGSSTLTLHLLVPILCLVGVMQSGL